MRVYAEISFVARMPGDQKFCTVVYRSNIQLMARILENFDGFDWDEGNSNKNWYLHRVTDSESEEIFSNRPLIVALDKSRKSKEQRYLAMGKTNSDRHLYVAFTIRADLLRIISVRDMTRGEERKYEEKA